MAAEQQQPDKESTALHHVASRLKAQFPDRAPAEVEAAVHAQHQQLSNSRIRDFLPVLIERAAREQLKTDRSGPGEAV